MQPINQNFIRITEAAKLANTDADYLHKLVRAGELRARYEQKGKLKYWYVDITCPRYQKLLKRNSQSTPLSLNSTLVQCGQHPIDWNLWEDMCRSGEAIVRDCCSSKTLEEYRRYLKNFFKTYSELTRDTLRSALKKYESKETIERDYYSSKTMLYRAAVTIAKYYIFKGFETQEYLRDIRFLKPKRKRTVVSRPCHTKETVDKGIQGIGQAKSKHGQRAYTYFDETLNRTLIILAFYTGARSGEICGIRLKDIDLKTGSIRLFGKGGKERTVGICPELKNALHEYKKVRPQSRSEYFLLHSKGKPLRPGYINRRLSRLQKYIEVENFIPHSLRRSAITWMLTQRKLPLPIVRDAVGHSSLTVTNTYAQPTANDVIEAMKTL